MRNTSLLLLVAGLVALFGLLAILPSAVRSQASGGVEIAITDTGFEPDSVAILSGESVHWTNESSSAHSVTSDGGLFASGSLQPGAGFSIALGILGIHTYHSTNNPDFKGEIRLLLTEIAGPPDALVSEHIPDLPLPPRTEDDTGTHPTLGIVTSRTRITVGFVDTATVAEANDALGAAGVEILGGDPDIGFVEVAVEDTPDFSALDAAVAILRAHPAVKYAALDSEIVFDVVPRPAESQTADGTQNTWEWELVFGPNDEPAGVGGNWGHEASRFPQAWNFLEEIVRRNNFPTVRTAVVDSGFEVHEDLKDTVTIETLCQPISGGGQQCTDNIPDDHGNATSGVISATYDNNTQPASGKSLGISGANPVAQTSAVIARFNPGGGSWKNAIQIMKLVVDQVPNVRVINMSAGLGPPGFTRDPVTKIPNASGWWALHGTSPTCGPGINDDEPPTAFQFCTPNNEDDWLEHVANLGMLARDVAEYAAANSVMISQSAGNEGDLLCIGTAPNSNDCQLVRLKAEVASPFGWAGKHWVSPLPNPILSVEAIGQDIIHTLFSNIDGDISAPGSKVVTTALNDGYLPFSGTSFSAPYVAALIGYLLAYDPSLSITDIRNRIRNWGGLDVIIGGQPRIDAFLTMMSLPGAARVLVDVNDNTKDGNQRVIRGFGNTEDGINIVSSNDINTFSGGLFLTDPDGVIDMRDFRRFRDAWLMACLMFGVGPGTDCDAFTGLNEILLDGDFIDPNIPIHPKKDLNFDGCVTETVSDPNCPTEEHEFPRFDFNGDGRVSRYDKKLVPLQANGSLAFILAETTQMTDLEVLQSQWAPDISKTEGYNRFALPGLLVSGDLEVHAEHFFNSGANEVEISIKRLDNNTLLPKRTIEQGDDFIIITAPAGVDLELWASATTPDTNLESPIEEVNLKAGEDKRLDMCTNTLQVYANPPLLIADDFSESEIVAELFACPGQDPQGLEVEFESSPSGGAHGFLDFTLDVTDADGFASTNFVAGTEVTEYEITATLDLGDGRTISGKVKLKTSEPIKIAYRWQQEVLEFTESGTTRWQEPTDADFDPSLGDCDDDTVPLGFPTDVIGWVYCVDHFEFNALPISVPPSPPPGFSGGNEAPSDLKLTREGILERVGGEMLLDEFVSDTLISGTYDYDVSYAVIPGVKIIESEGRVSYKVPLDQREINQDYALPPSVFFHLGPDGMELHGLSALADIEYFYETSEVETGTFYATDGSGTVIAVPTIYPTYNEEVVAPDGTSGFTQNIGYPPDVFGNAGSAGTHRPDLMLVPREDDSSIRYSPDMTKPIVFPVDENGEFRKYEYCEIVEKDYEVPPAYLSLFDMEKWFSGDFGIRGRLWKRNSTYVPPPFGSEAHEGPTPAGQGHSKMRYSIVAIPFVDQGQLEAAVQAGLFEIPTTCQQNQAPEASFGFQPDPAIVGEPVQFLDLSSSEGNSIIEWEWDFGDNSLSFEMEPEHVYSAPGTYTVKLKVTDAAGATDTTVQQITVEADPGPNPHAKLPEFITFTTSVEPSVQPKQMLLVSDPPVPALVISNVSPEAGVSVTFWNVSRDASGQPIAAVLDPGDGTGPFNLGAVSPRQHTYASGGSFTVGLTATDSAGASLTVQRDIDVTEPPPEPPDFNLTLSPDTQVMAPGTTATFLVSLTSLNGFSSPVGLSVESLPSGFTALFTPPTVTPSGTSILQIFAATNAQTGQFTLDVTASGGGITHTTSSALTVNFGLVPVCFGAFEGTVTDIETGLPLQGVNTAFGTGEILTDASGHYVIPKVNLNPDGSARAYNIQARGLAGYWTANKGGTAICGVVTTVNIQMLRIKYASMSGFVFEGVPDPNDHTANRAVTPTDIPIEGVNVGLSSSENWQTDATGFYESPPITPGTNNTPLTGRVPHAIKNDYWGNNSSVTIIAGQHLDKDFALVPKCYVAITVNATFGDTGLPASGVQLRLAVAGGGIFRSTDASGQFTFEHLELGFNNSSVSRNLSVLTQFEDYHPLHPTTSPLPVPLLDCDASPVVNLVFQPRVPNFSAMQGHVYDEETGAPVAGAGVSASQPFPFLTKQTTADADGAYTLEQFFVGYDNQTTWNTTAHAFHSDYWGADKPVTLNANQTHTVDFTILKKRFGFIAGTLRDAVTHQPVEGANVSGIGVTAPTGADGHFQSGPLGLLSGNQPATGYSYTASRLGYWNKQVFGIVVRADETTIADVDLLPVCPGATIVGTVVNAATGEPLEAVRVTFNGGNQVFTDANGNFAVQNIKVGTNNSPLNVSVQASKTGFVTQTKVVTIFCSASIVVNFGQTNTAVGTIQGTVTDATTGQLMQGVFIGSEFGGSATTNSQGQYTLTNVPLGPNNSDRQWDITAVPPGAPPAFPPQTRPVTAIANQVSILDFEFSSDTNAPPVLDSIGDQSLDENTTLDVAISATDPDGDPITLSASGLPPFAVFTDNGDGTGVLSLLPGFDDAGVYPSVQVTASDGDLSDGETFTITVHNVNRPPVADAGGPYAMNEGDPVTLDGSASSDPDGDSLTYEWDLDNDGEFDDATGAQVSHTFQDDGVYSAGLRVSDGDLSDTATASVTVSDLGPTAAFDWTPKPQLEGADVAFTEQSTSSPDAIASWDWDFAGLGSSDQQHPTFAFPDDGDYTVTLTVTDDDGSTDTIAQTVTIANAPPAVDAGPDQSVMQGDEVAFSGSFTDPGQDTHTIEWDFGDGGTGEGTLTPSHVFDQPGIYTVTLVVTDDDGGVGTDTLEVEVQQATPPVEPDLPAEADLSIAKSASPDPATSGKPLAYTILVQNHGPSDATGILVTDALPAGVAYDPSQSSQQCAEAGAVIVCDVGDLAVNASVELVIAVNVPITTVGTLVNAAEVSANEPDPDSDNNEAIVQVEAALPEIALVNGALEQIGLQTSYNPSDGRAPAGVFRITVAWRNVSAFGYFDMHAEVVILTGGNLLLNADGGPGGVGAIASVADAALGGDGLLTPGETFTQTYEIGLAVRQQFSFFVNVYGRDP